MNSEFTQRLFEQFDRLYRGRHLPLTHNLMSEGFDCGDGWFTLLWQLSEAIEVYGRTHPDTADLMAVQVKQKFGELRFYTRPRIEEVQALIEAARLRSRQTCELTGEPGELGQLQSDVGFCCYQTLSPTKAAELGFVPVSRSRESLE